MSVQRNLKKRKSPSASPSDNRNAFSVLMQGSTQKRSRPSGARFVVCPAGCGKHIPELRINEHLDQCISSSPTDAKEQEARPKEQQQQQQHTSSPPTMAEKEKIETTLQPVSPHCINPPLGTSKQHDSTTISPKSPGSRGNSNTEQNAFHHMMQHSTRVFSKKQLPPLQQKVHLNDNLRLSFYCSYSGSDGTVNTNTFQDRVVWSTKLNIKAPKGEPSKPTTTVSSRRDVELTLTSSLPSLLVVTTTPTATTTRRRLVQRHSRLSVPVLKSMLQKSIRRRRPLPSVRIAMELMDKSIGDFLRRLPIILLEDSTLHPDTPLVVWLMVAHSKDYELSRYLEIALLRIVFEAASCPWKDDDLSSGDEKEQSVSQEQSVVSLFEPDFWLHHSKDRPLICQTLLWSLLVRAEYGGMKGDVRMLHAYAKCWDRRFAGTVPQSLCQRRFGGSSEPTYHLKWWDIPARIHQSARTKSETHVMTLLQNSGSLPKLSMQDACLEGVDFHCSSILNSVLDDSQLVAEFCKRMQEAPIGSSPDPMPSATADRRLWLESLWKSSMWKYSSGVNFRRSLLSGDSSKKDTSFVKNIWDELVAPKVKAYMEDYVRKRLAL